jgi:hypothetical protein
MILANVKFSSPTLTFLFARKIKHNCSGSYEFEIEMRSNHSNKQMFESLESLMI